MEHPAIHFGTVFMAFFAIMNPVANAPMFLGLTQGLDRKTQRGIALRSVLLAFIIIAVFTVGGRMIFSVFGITLPAFRIAGGILIGMVGFQMLQGKQSAVHTTSEADNEASQEAALGIAITPLALPILAGPVTIATAMSFAAQSTMPEITRVLVAFAIMCVLTFVSFLASGTLTRVLGQNAISVVTRLMLLILAVIGVQMLITGIRGAVAATGAS